MGKKKRRVLIVEDEISLLNVLCDMFEKEKFKVYRAENGEEGLDMALKLHPDIILTDILMPKMDGITFIQLLKKDQWGSGVPVIILTNISDQKEFLIAQNIGIAGYLLKAEWSLKDIVKKVNSVLDL